MVFTWEISEGTEAKLSLSGILICHVNQLIQCFTHCSTCATNKFWILLTTNAFTYHNPILPVNFQMLNYFYVIHKLKSFKCWLYYYTIFLGEVLCIFTLYNITIGKLITLCVLVTNRLCEYFLFIDHVHFDLHSYPDSISIL